MSLLGAEIEMGGLNIEATLATGLDVPRECRKNMLKPLCNCYRAKDGRWIQLYMPKSDPYWSGFCRVMGIEHLEHDNRFDSMAKRMEHSEELIAILDGIFVTRTTAEWKQRDQEVELAPQVVNSFAEAAADRQVSENEYVMDFDHPTAGWIKMVGSPVQRSKTPGKITAAAPELGQHTEEIMQDLGYTWDEIVRLKDEENTLGRDMMPDSKFIEKVKPFIGFISVSSAIEIEQGMIKKFVEAIGDDNLLWKDDQYAKRMGIAE